jgi:S-adenosylmethionine:tRNA ribosyltransferase-isomerase
LPWLLSPGDLLVLNDSRVLPARLLGVSEKTGSPMEFLLLEQKQALVWEVLVRPGKRARPGARFVFGDGVLGAEVLEICEEGNRLVRFFCAENFYTTLERVGQTPLPPYITEELEDAERYQTVYSKIPGSSAAPTAGLHFTDELLLKIQALGVGVEFVTLHVGLGTFRPVKEREILNHHMHSEHISLSAQTAERINETRARGGRVIAVGTTSCRTLEACAQKGLPLQPFEGYTDLFLYPGKQFLLIDGLITNFHLPESTLLMLVCAFAGVENTFAAYREAICREYRFFSFGDAMFIADGIENSHV